MWLIDWLIVSASTPNMVVVSLIGHVTAREHEPRASGEKQKTENSFKVSETICSY